MGFLRSAFTSGPKKDLFHSSGIVGGSDAETLGATSAESFEQRRKLEGNRQLVGGYSDAGVLHNYRKDARGQQLQSQTDQARSTPEPGSVRARGTYQNRIDIVKPIRQVGGIGQNVPSRPTFREPPTRGYNPYQ